LAARQAAALIKRDGALNKVRAIGNQGSNARQRRAALLTEFGPHVEETSGRQAAQPE
jgi:hypothetical protein